MTMTPSTAAKGSQRPIRPSSSVGSTSTTKNAVDSITPISSKPSRLRCGNHPPLRQRAEPERAAQPGGHQHGDAQRREGFAIHAVAPLPPANLAAMMRVRIITRDPHAPFICTACGTQYPESDKPPAHMPICEEERQYVPPRGQSWTTLDALRTEPHEQLSRIRAGRDRHRLAAVLRHRPARAAGAHARRQCVVGLHRHARRRDRHDDQGPRRHPGDRHLASAFLHHDGGMGAGLRLPDPSQRRRQRLDHAPGSRR